MLIVYFAGFATAIYTLVPVSEQAQKVRAVFKDKSRFDSNFDSERFAKVASNKLHKFVSFAGDKASELGGIIKVKLAERRKYSSN